MLKGVDGRWPLFAVTPQMTQRGSVGAGAIELMVREAANV
jgi:hypothetical protein